MRKISIKNFLFGLIGILAVSLLAILTTPVAAGLFIAAAGVATTSTVTEQFARENASTLDMEDVAKLVTEMNPSKTPVDTIMAMLRKAEKAEAMIKRYYSVSSKALSDTLDSSASGAGTSASVPAKAYTYSSGAGLTSIYVAVNNANLWAKNDTVLMRNLTLPTTAGDPVLGGSGTIVYDCPFIITEISGTTLRLVPIGPLKGKNSGGTDNSKKMVVPNFADTTVLYRMGRAEHELAASTSAYAVLPEPDEQYGQNFMAQIEESTFQKMTKKEVDWGFSDFERNNIYDMRSTKEFSYLFGLKGYTLNPNDTTQKIYTTGGITRGISKALTYGTGSTNRTVSFGNVINWCRTLFTDNSGSDERFLFGGAGLVEYMHSVETIQKQINGKAPVVRWGLKFREIETNFGMLYIYHHPLLTSTGWADNGIVLDLEHVRKHDFIPLTIKPLDLRLAGTKNADATVIQEASFLTLSYPDCHAIIKPKA